MSLRSFLYYKKYPVSALMEYLGHKSLPIILKAEEKRFKVPVLYTPNSSFSDLKEGGIQLALRLDCMFCYQ